MGYTLQNNQSRCNVGGLADEIGEATAVYPRKKRNLLFVSVTSLWLKRWYMLHRINNGFAVTIPLLSD